jgi:hypothetical protein
MKTLADKNIDVTAFYFQQQRCFPRRIEVNGQPVAILESGLRRLVSRGQDLIEIFNMTDGYAQYDLQHDLAGGGWRLLGTHQL